MSMSNVKTKNLTEKASCHELNAYIYDDIKITIATDKFKAFEFCCRIDSILRGLQHRDEKIMTCAIFDVEDDHPVIKFGAECYEEGTCASCLKSEDLVLHIIAYTIENSNVYNYRIKAEYMNNKAYWTVRDIFLDDVILKASITEFMDEIIPLANKEAGYGMD